MYLLLLSFIVMSHFQCVRFVLSYYIIFYCYPLLACLFSNETQKRDLSRWERRWRGTRRSRWRGNSNQSVLYEKKTFSIKGKNKIVKIDLRKSDKATYLKFPDCKMHCRSTVIRQYRTTSVRATDAKMNELKQQTRVDWSKEFRSRLCTWGRTSSSTNIIVTIHMQHDFGLFPFTKFKVQRQNKNNTWNDKTGRKYSTHLSNDILAIIQTQSTRAKVDKYDRIKLESFDTVKKHRKTQPVEWYL